MADEPASGRQLELRFDRQRAVVVEVGGGLRQYTVDDWHVLDGYPLERIADGGRGQPLLPWPNRLADGRYTFAGEHLQLPIDEVTRFNAIHGLTRWLNWSVDEQAPATARVGLTLHPRPGYPFALRLTIDYALDAAGLSVRTTAHNCGDRPLPFGAGQHPYFSVGTPLVDAANLELPAQTRLELDPERRLPTGRRVPVANSEWDFRRARPIGSLEIDDCFADLQRGPDGRARVRLEDPLSGRGLTVWLDPHYRYLQAFSGDTLAPERRRRGLALEPMTCPPDAFRTGTEIIVLESDEAITLAWGVSPTLLA